LQARLVRSARVTGFDDAQKIDMILKTGTFAPSSEMLLQPRCCWRQLGAQPQAPTCGGHRGGSSSVTLTVVRNRRILIGMAQSGFSGPATNGVNATGASDGGDVLRIERASFASFRSSIVPKPSRHRPRDFQLCPIHDLATMLPNLPLV
jgi:hypothetical protein